MATVANIIYSGGTLNLLDGTNYVLQDEGWTPAVTYLRDSDFGGISEYADVDETMRVLINGSTASARYQNIRSLQRALDEATRWARGEKLSAVKLQFAPEGAGAGTLECVILGRPRGGPNPYQASNWYGAAANAIPDNALTFRRRGLWLEGSETSQAGTASVSNKVVTISSFASHPVPSPARLTISGTINQGNYVALGQYAYLLAASGASDLQSFSAIASVGGWPGLSSVVESGSTWGNILRFTPASGNSQGQVYTPASGIRTSQLIHVYVNTRRSSISGPDYTLRIDATLNDGTVINGQSVVLASGAGPNNQVMPVYLGAFAIAGNLSTLTLAMSAVSSGSLVGHTLDLDTVAVLAENDAYARIIALNLPLNSSQTLTVDHQLLSAPEPAVTHSTSPVAYQGDAALAMTGATIKTCFFAGSSINFTNGGGSTHTTTAYRRKAFYLPE